MLGGLSILNLQSGLWSREPYQGGQFRHGLFDIFYRNDDGAKSHCRHWRTERVHSPPRSTPRVRLRGLPCLRPVGRCSYRSRGHEPKAGHRRAAMAGSRHALRRDGISRLVWGEKPVIRDTIHRRSIGGEQQFGELPQNHGHVSRPNLAQSSRLPRHRRAPRNDRDALSRASGGICRRGDDRVVPVLLFTGIRRDPTETYLFTASVMAHS